MKAILNDETYKRVIGKKDPVKTCSICKKKFVGLGNNPQPVRTSGEDRCCDDCNNTVVVPRRFREVNREIN